MTENDLSEIESQLKIVLPTSYRKMMLSRSAELEADGGLGEPFYLDAKLLIGANRSERSANSGTGYAFPKWWKTFLLIGDDGAGGYYCVRLDNKPGVWMIGSDTESEDPEKKHASLSEYIDELLANRAEQLEWQAKAGRSSFDGSCPPAERVSIVYTDVFVFNGYLSVIYQGTAGNLTADVLTDGGVDLQKMRGRVSMLTGCLLQCAPEEFKVAPPKVIEGDDGQPVVKFEITDLTMQMGLARGYPYAQLKARAGAAELEFSGWRQGPPAQITSLDWPAVINALGELFEAACPGNVFAIVAEPAKPARKSDRLIYTLPYTLQEEGQKLTGDERVRLHASNEAEIAAGCAPPPEQGPWDYSWKHPSISEDELKERFRALGTDALPQGRITESARLAFADWLEKKGDKAWASYIRVRSELDGKPPGDNYPDLCEQLLESAAAADWGDFTLAPLRAGSNELEPGADNYFIESRGVGEADEWHGHAGEDDGMAYGLLSCVSVEGPPRSIPALLRDIEALLQATPVRGLDFEWHYAEEMDEILKAPAMRQLRWLAFANRPEQGKIGPVIEALVKSPVVRTLERLHVTESLRSDGEACVLASAPFESLRWLGLRYWKGDFPALLQAPWFRKLERLHMGSNHENLSSLAGMPNLHTLSLGVSPPEDPRAMAIRGEFPALRRLHLHAPHLIGHFSEVFGAVKMPKLTELWLENCATNADMEVLARLPLFDNLRVLSLRGRPLDATALEALAASKCAGSLSILRIHGGGDCEGDFRSLAATPLTKTGAFPNLTTLKLEYPYPNKAKRDTAKFLKGLATPKLRHLTLYSCKFDDACADILATSPTFANLTRLRIDGDAYDGPGKRAAQKMLRSPNFRNVVELGMRYAEDPVASGLNILVDRSVMPRLALLHTGWYPYLVRRSELGG
jgi:hypothetical protein